MHGHLNVKFDISTVGVRRETRFRANIILILKTVVYFHSKVHRLCQYSFAEASLLMALSPWHALKEFLRQNLASQKQTFQS